MYTFCYCFPIGISEVMETKTVTSSCVSGKRLACSTQHFSFNGCKACGPHGVVSIPIDFMKLLQLWSFCWNLKYWEVSNNSRPVFICFVWSCMIFALHFLCFFMSFTFFVLQIVMVWYCCCLLIYSQRCQLHSNNSSIYTITLSLQAQSK